MEGIMPTMELNRNDDWGGGGSWILILVIALLFNRNGFGGCGEGGCVNNELDMLNSNFNSRLSSLEDNVNFNHQFTNQAIQGVDEKAAIRENYKETCATNMNVSQTGAGIQREVLEAKFDNAVIAKDAEISLLECCCNTNRNIDDLRYDTARNVDQLRFDTTVLAKDAELRDQECCCMTNRNIDQLRFDTSKEMTAVIANQDANTQKILDRMSAYEVQGLRDKIADLSNFKSQCIQTETLINAIRPTAIPAYPSCSPYVPTVGLYGGLGDGCCC